jgi:hypothetical protein
MFFLLIFGFLREIFIENIESTIILVFSYSIICLNFRFLAAILLDAAHFKIEK